MKTDKREKLRQTFGNVLAAALGDARYAKPCSLKVVVVADSPVSAPKELYIEASDVLMAEWVFPSDKGPEPLS